MIRFKYFVRYYILSEQLMSQKKSFQLIIHFVENNDSITTNHSNPIVRKEFQREFQIRFNNFTRVQYEHRTKLIDSNINFDRYVSDFVN